MSATGGRAGVGAVDLTPGSKRDRHRGLWKEGIP
jgi:hypothetical protein